MNYNPEIFHRQSIRLKGFPYSQNGLYYLTLCVQEKLALFGIITKDENGSYMELNSTGKMLGKWFNELENKYPDKKCLDMVIMPNHVHFIVQNGKDVIFWENTGYQFGADNHKKSRLLQNKVLNASIGNLVDWFKTMTINEYIRGVKHYRLKCFHKKLWQRNFYEHIIRSEEDYERISVYIRNNPAKWEEDDFYKRFENM